MKAKLPVVVSTWDSGIRANAAAWPVLARKGSALDAVEAAGRAAELEQSCCVGLGANPDRDGTVTLDACIMNGNGDCGSVAYLERIKHPVSVARKVMELTPHVLLAGRGAQQFAAANGFAIESGELSPEAEREWKKWLEKSNYKPEINIENKKVSQAAPYFLSEGSPNHDTMGTVAIDSRGKLAGMVTTSGMAFKMHGRVGDSPIIGGGLFVDDEVGAATSSGVRRGHPHLRDAHRYRTNANGPLARSRLAARPSAESSNAARPRQRNFRSVSSPSHAAARSAFAIQRGYVLYHEC